MRSCLGCGVIIRFDQDPCPECGAPAREAPAEERVKECAACGALVPFDELYCTACGQLTIELEEDEIPRRIELDPGMSPLERAAAWGAVASLAAGLSALGFAGVRIFL